ncbi:hypothetical protein OAD61_00705 [bacterium]|nr:hypothetical protein [bacterium]
MLKIKTVTMEEKIIDILSEVIPVSHKDFNHTVKELLNLFPVINCKCNHKIEDRFPTELLMKECEDCNGVL